MAFTFDTLGYARELQEAGVPRKQAEAQAEAARKFIMNELVTKEDLRLALDTLALKLTIRLGTIITAAIGTFAVIGQLLK